MPVQEAGEKKMPHRRLQLGLHLHLELAFEMMRCDGVSAVHRKLRQVGFPCRIRDDRGADILLESQAIEVTAKVPHHGGDRGVLLDVLIEPRESSRFHKPRRVAADDNTFVHIQNIARHMGVQTCGVSHGVTDCLDG